MKKIFTVYLVFVHCILINASQKPNGIIARISGCISQIAETSQNIIEAGQLVREKSPEVRRICNCVAITCACASCYYCPQFCLCTSGCALYTTAGYLIHKKYISTQPKAE